MTDINADLADLGMLCKALGFLAVAMKNENVQAGSGAQALKLANLIEEFCRSGEAGLPNAARAHPVRAVKPLQPGDIWTCEHQDGRSTIRMPARADTKQDALAELRGDSVAETRSAAEKIVHAVNDNSRKNALIAEMSACLELYIATERLNGDATREANILLARAREKQ